MNIVEGPPIHKRKQIGTHKGIPVIEGPPIHKKKQIGTHKGIPVVEGPPIFKRNKIPIVEGPPLKAKALKIKMDGGSFNISQFIKQGQQALQQGQKVWNQGQQIYQQVKPVMQQGQQYWNSPQGQQLKGMLPQNVLQDTKEFRQQLGNIVTPQVPPQGPQEVPQQGGGHRCKGKTQKGKQCKNRVKGRKVYCRLH